MKKILAVLAEVFVLCLILMPESALASGAAAMLLWASAVAPVLFPFLAVLPLLTCSEACKVYDRILGWLVKPLFAIPGAMASATVIGMVAGSPAGALAAVRVAKECHVRQSELKRTALSFTGLSPVFLLSGVGLAMYGSRQVGIALVCAQIVSQLATAAVLRFFFRKEDAPVSCDLPESTNSRPVLEAALNVISVCGYMVLFSVAAGMLAEAFGQSVGTSFLYVLDCPSGSAAAAALNGNLRFRVALTGGMLGFGGLCIACQNMAVLGRAGVRWQEYLGAKLFSALICAATAWLLSPARAAVPTFSGDLPMFAVRVSSLGAMLAAIPVVISLAMSGILNIRKNAGKSERYPQNPLNG